MNTWTPVSTLPPNDYQWLLVVFNCGTPSPPHVILGYYDYRTQSWRGQSGRFADHWRVTHWMPLPELPEEESR